jgi:hypothetical protein
MNLLFTERSERLKIKMMFIYAMDNPANFDKKNDFGKSDPFTTGMAFWQNLVSIYSQSINDIQRINDLYRESIEITKEMGNLYQELAIRIEKMNQLYRESAEITERMNKFWLDNIWKFFLSNKEKEQK